MIALCTSSKHKYILLLIGSSVWIVCLQVDTFSFGMFMFELLTCRLPLADVSNITVHVAHGGRPTLTTEVRKHPENCGHIILQFIGYMCNHLWIKIIIIINVVVIVVVIIIIVVISIIVVIVVVTVITIVIVITITIVITIIVIIVIITIIVVISIFVVIIIVIACF